MAQHGLFIGFMPSDTVRIEDIFFINNLIHNLRIFQISHFYFSSLRYLLFLIQVAIHLHVCIMSSF